MEVVPELSFTSVKEFKDTVLGGKLSKEQKEIMNKFPKNESGEVITFDMNNWHTPTLPKNISVSSVNWRGSVYYFEIEVDDNSGFGYIDYYTYAKNSYDRHLSDFDSTFENDNVTITEHKRVDDGRGGEKNEVYFKSSITSLKKVRYTLIERNKTFVVDKLYHLASSNPYVQTSETIPQRIQICCVENDEYYVVRLYELTEDPSDSWLLDFGLTKYVEGNTVEK